MHKIRSFFFAIGLLIFWMAAADGGRLVVTTAGDPKVVLPSQQHVFEPIVEGVQTQHAFTGIAQERENARIHQAAAQSIWSLAKRTAGNNDNRREGPRRPSFAPHSLCVVDPDPILI